MEYRQETTELLYGEQKKFLVEIFGQINKLEPAEIPLSEATHTPETQFIETSLPEALTIEQFIAAFCNINEIHYEMGGIYYPDNRKLLLHRSHDEPENERLIPYPETQLKLPVFLPLKKSGTIDFHTHIYKKTGYSSMDNDFSQLDLQTILEQQNEGYKQTYLVGWGVPESQQIKLSKINILGPWKFPTPKELKAVGVEKDDFIHQRLSTYFKDKVYFPDELTQSAPWLATASAEQRNLFRRMKNIEGPIHEKIEDIFGINKSDL